MFKKKKLHEIVKKLMAETGRAVPLLKNCAYKPFRGTEWLEFFGIEDDYSSYKITANQGQIYIEEKRDGKVVREDQYFDVCKDGTCTRHRPRVFV